MSETVARPLLAEAAVELRTAHIAGLGHHVPEREIPNAEIAERIGVDDEWIVRRTGIRSRRWAGEGETLTSMAAAAAERALADAGIEASELDLVLVATMTPDEICPNAAPRLTDAIGALNAGAIDVGAACTGWLAGLRLAAGQVEAGRADRVLVVGADRLSAITNLDDPQTAALFADGAGAVVVTAGGDGERGDDEGEAHGSGIGSIVLAADGSLGDRIVADHDERVLRMDGHSTYQVAVKRLTEATVAATERAGLALDDIDLFVYHQANGRIIRAVGERLGLPSDRVADYVDRMANTSAASIPLTLGLLREDGRLHAGQRVLVAAIGGGFTWGAGILEWELP
jgi:3-oxoacyl-[acyl-carrier-protein] synthase-3